MGCAGSKSNLKASIDNLSSKQQQIKPGYIQLDSKKVLFLKENQQDIKEKLKKRCEDRLIKKRLQSSSFKSSMINSTRRKLDDSLVISKINRSNLSLREADSIEIKFQMIDLAVNHVLKYALNEYQLNTHLSLEQLRNNIIKYNSTISPDYSMYSIGSANIVDSNNNISNGESDNRFYKKALNVAVDELDELLRESSILIDQFKLNDVSSNGDVLQSDEPVLKLKDALDVARHMFYEGKYSTIYSTKSGGYVVRETQLPNGATIENQQVTSFVNEAV